MMDWKQLHATFERLWQAYGRSHQNAELGYQVLRHAMNPERYDFAFVEREARGFGLAIDLVRDWPQIESLRKVHRTLSEIGFASDSPAESVYQTAIQIRLQRLPDAADRWFYRGQRDHRWPTVPKLFREMPNEDAALAQILGHRIMRVRSIVAALKSLGIARDDLEATAVVQHYSFELDASTWLLDVSASPWVSLFFASDNGEENGIGLLEYIEFGEWQLFSRSGDSVMGTIRATSPDLVPRIASQQAFFIQAPHPHLFEQLRNRALYFCQQRGVAFECDVLVPPVNHAHIYPKADPTIMRLQALVPQSDAPPLEWEPTLDHIRAPDWTMYRSIARGLLERECERRAEASAVPDASIDWNEVIDEVCRLHAAVHESRAQLPVYICSLHHLRRLIEMAYMVASEGVDMEFFLEFNYFQYCRNDATVREVLEGCLRNASPFWSEVLGRQASGTPDKT